tara:strand:+ start:44820 stop:45812 length:993 start_codon:yes stop_codon:yes gene_type:complete
VEFFNKKEDVIDLQITQYGRYLLSKGNFKPEFYSFFDDNILYDSLSAGVIELQNDSEFRIREAQTMKPQVGHSSLEKEFANSYELILTGDEEVGAQALQRTAEKNYSLPAPIGTSNLNSNYAPSWVVNFLNGKLSGSVSYMNLQEKSGGKNTLMIPQLETEMIIEGISVENMEGMDQDESEDGTLLSNFAITSDEEKMFFLFKLTEENGLYQNKNFDIEIFEIQEEEQGDNMIETLIPLKFLQPHHQMSAVSYMEQEIPVPSEMDVDFYFDLFVDDEIGDEVLCTYDPVDESKGVFSDPKTKICLDVLGEEGTKTFDIYEDESDDPGEVC